MSKPYNNFFNKRYLMKKKHLLQRHRNIYDYFQDVLCSILRATPADLALKQFYHYLQGMKSGMFVISINHFKLSLPKLWNLTLFSAVLYWIKNIHLMYSEYFEYIRYFDSEDLFKMCLFLNMKKYFEPWKYIQIISRTLKYIFEYLITSYVFEYSLCIQIQFMYSTALYC